MARVGCPAFAKEEMGHRQEKGHHLGAALNNITLLHKRQGEGGQVGGSIRGRPGWLKPLSFQSQRAIMGEEWRQWTMVKTASGLDPQDLA